MLEISAFNSMLIPIVIGMLLLTIGFNFRDSKPGVLSIWFGFYPNWGAGW